MSDDLQRVNQFYSTRLRLMDGTPVITNIFMFLLDIYVKY